MFFGTAEFAVPSLEQLAAHHHVAACVTQPERPQGRGLEREPSPVKRAAQRLGVPLLQPERLHASLVEPLHSEVGVVAAYGNLIPRALLDLPIHGMVGVHPSLLPKYRGAAPVAWALLNGETVTGVTIFRLSERLDAGEIMSQRRVAIELAEHADTLTRRLAQLGAEELVRTLEALATGRAIFTPQEEADASFAPKLTKSQGSIDWRKPADAIERLVRAVIPWPGAIAQWRGEPLKVWRVSVSSAAAAPSVEPGTVVRVSAETVSVATGQGTVNLEEVQPPGRRRMRISEFLAGHKISVGESFGNSSSDY